jgi:serine protease Do
VVKGVMVVGAQESSAVFKAGLRPGDVIVSANRKPISQLDELQIIAKSTPKKLLLQVLRGDGALFIIVE